MKLRGHRHEAFVGSLRDELLALNTPGSDELHRASLAALGVARAYASVVNALLFDTGTVAREVRAIGAHGQTVRHRPEAGYTTQLLNGALLAELTGIDVVCDLRSRDVAAGGQGAPLAPGFHAAVFGHAEETCAVLNLGGISNLTLLAPGKPVIGFDCGPANALLDGWCRASFAAALRCRWTVGGERPRDTAVAGRAARRALLRSAAAEEHRARPVQHGLARRPCRRRQQQSMCRQR